MIHTSTSAGIYGGMKIPVAIAVKPLHGCFSRSVGTHRGLIMARRLTASEALHSVLERDYSSDEESEIDEAYSFPLPRPPSDEELPASPARASSPAYCCTPPRSGMSTASMASASPSPAGSPTPTAPPSTATSRRSGRGRPRRNAGKQ